MNKKEAVKYYRIAAYKGLNEAIMAYAEMLIQGDGIKQNKDEAIRYLKIAAEKENMNTLNKINELIK